MKHFTIVVSGKVQGVFFRASARDVAEKSGVKGFVKNQPDGGVLLEAEGDEENLNQFIEWCRHGPPRAEVTDVIVTEGMVVNFKNFEIRR
jgi:acylphosphatase